jgi:hypothetical protein
MLDPNSPDQVGNAVSSIVEKYRDRLELETKARVVSKEELDHAKAGLSAPRRAINLQGWDTVSTINFAALNPAITAQVALPATFSHDMKSGGQVEASLSGSFGPWQLALNGGGNEIYLRVPVHNAVVQFPPGVPANASDGDVVIQVNAAYFPQSGNANRRDLKINTKPVSANANDGTVTVCQPGGKDADPLKTQLFYSMIQEWFNDNLDLLRLVFTTADLAADYKSSAMAWVKPSEVAYAVSVPHLSTMRNASLGVLALVDGGTITGQQSEQYDPALIPEGCDAGLAISRRKYLEHMILPAVPYMFDPEVSSQPSAANFELQNDEGQVTNKVELKMHRMRLSNGDTVSPVVAPGNFTLTVNGEFVDVAIVDAAFPAGIGLTAKLTYRNTMELYFDAGANNGKGAIRLKDRNKSCHMAVEQAAWLLDLEIGEEIVLGLLSLVGIAGGVLGWIAKGAAEGAEVAIESVAIATEAGEDAAEEGQGILAGLKAMRAAAGLTLKATGVPFSTISKYAFAGAAAFTLARAGQVINYELTEKDYADSSADFLDIAQDAFQKTVLWPDTAGRFVLKTVEMNESLQFGFQKVAPNG